MGECKRQRRFTLASAGALAGWIIFGSSHYGCAVGNNLPAPTTPTAIEQMLMGQAVESGLSTWDPTHLPLENEATLMLQVSGLPPQKAFIKHQMAKWLGEQGYRIVEKPQDARYTVNILVQALGVEQAVSFLGMPPVQSVLLPFALPELTLFKGQYRKGYTRFRLDVFESATGQFVRSTPWYHATTYHHHYTILFFIAFRTTNLVDLP